MAKGICTLAVPPIRSISPGRPKTGRIHQYLHNCNKFQFVGKGSPNNLNDTKASFDVP